MCVYRSVPVARTGLTIDLIKAKSRAIEARLEILVDSLRVGDGRSQGSRIL